jgi:hypothetical protein
MKLGGLDLIRGSLAVAFSLFGFTCSNENLVLTPQERVGVIEQLQRAKEADIEIAMDTSIGPVAQGDYLIQAQKADIAIKDLKKHSDVPKAEVSDALFTPPRQITPEMRSQLVKQLEQAKELDDQKWRNNLGSEDENWLTLLCDIQARRATRVIKKLNGYQPVSWVEINDAMTTPEEIP